MNWTGFCRALDGLLPTQIMAVKELDQAQIVPQSPDATAVASTAVVTRGYDVAAGGRVPLPSYDGAIHMYGIAQMTHKTEMIINWRNVLSTKRETTTTDRYLVSPKDFDLARGSIESRRDTLIADHESALQDLDGELAALNAAEAVVMELARGAAAAPLVVPSLDPETVGPRQGRGRPKPMNTAEASATPLEPQPDGKPPKRPVPSRPVPSGRPWTSEEEDRLAVSEKDDLAGIALEMGRPHGGVKKRHAMIHKQRRGADVPPTTETAAHAAAPLVAPSSDPETVDAGAMRDEPPAPPPTPEPPKPSSSETEGNFEPTPPERRSPVATPAVSAWEPPPRDKSTLPETSQIPEPASYDDGRFSPKLAEKLRRYSVFEDRGSSAGRRTAVFDEPSIIPEPSKDQLRGGR